MYLSSLTMLEIDLNVSSILVTNHNHALFNHL